MPRHDLRHGDGDGGGGEVRRERVVVRVSARAGARGAPLRDVGARGAGGAAVQVLAAVAADGDAYVVTEGEAGRAVDARA